MHNSFFTPFLIPPSFTTFSKNQRCTFRSVPHTSNSYNPHDGIAGQNVLVENVSERSNSEHLLRLHEQRGRKILAAAVQNGAEALILGAFGCGAFRNDPQIVARAYKNILPDYLHYFKTIEFAVWCRPT
mgnify:FL=1